MGERNPTSSTSSRVHRQAFIYLVSAGATVDQTQVTKVDTIRKRVGHLLRAGDQQPHEGGDVAQVAGASGKLPPS